MCVAPLVWRCDIVIRHMESAIMVQIPDVVVVVYIALMSMGKLSLLHPGIITMTE